MGSGRKSRSERSDLEKDLLKTMIDYGVDQTDLARYAGISPQAINNRLKRLNKTKVEEFKLLIKKTAENMNGQG